MDEAPGVGDQGIVFGGNREFFRRISEHPRTLAVADPRTRHAVANVCVSAGGADRCSAIRHAPRRLVPPVAWLRKYGGMQVSGAKRLRAVDEENRRLKRIVGDKALNLQVLKDSLGNAW